jgi:serine/threonine kinase PknH
VSVIHSRSEAGTIFGTRPLGGRDGRSDQVYQQMVHTRPVVDNDCSQDLPPWPRTTQGSGWQAVRRQYLTTQNSESREKARSLNQAVVNFLDAAAAQQFVDTSKAAWQRCANRSVNLKTASDTTVASDYWNTGAVSETSGGIAMVWTQEGQDDWSCDDSMTAHNNIVIELELCGASPSKPVDEVLAQISDKIEAAK